MPDRRRHPGAESLRMWRATTSLVSRESPGYCMMNLTHTGVVNMVLGKSCGLYVRVEDIRLL